MAIMRIAPVALPFSSPRFVPDTTALAALYTRMGVNLSQLDLQKGQIAQQGADRLGQIFGNYVAGRHEEDLNKAAVARATAQHIADQAFQAAQAKQAQDAVLAEHVADAAEREKERQESIAAATQQHAEAGVSSAIDRAPRGLVDNALFKAAQQFPNQAAKFITQDGVAVLPMTPQEKQAADAAKSAAADRAIAAEDRRTSADRLQQQFEESKRHNLAEEANAAAKKTADAADAIGDPTLTGEAFLKTVPPDMQDQIRQLAEGRQPFPVGMGASKLQGLINAVANYDHTFDAGNYNARNKARMDLTSPNGKGGQTINALNTAVKHAGMLSDAVEQLDNFSVAPGVLNAPTNFVKKNIVGSSAPTNYDVVAPQSMKEIERLWRATGGSQADIDKLESSMDRNMGKQQQRDALNHFIGLLQGKLETTTQQRDNALGAAGGQVPVLYPGSQEIMNAIADRAAGKKATIGGAPAAGPAVGERRTIQGQPAEWDGHGWLPVKR